MDSLQCPFCGFSDQDEYQMLYHIEVNHSEDGESPFVVKDALAASQDQITGSTYEANSSTEQISSKTEYIDCPYECGEQILDTELQFHIDFHIAENITIEESTIINKMDTSSRTLSLVDTDNMISNFNTSIQEPLRNYDSASRASAKTTRATKSRSLRDLFLLRTPIKAESQRKHLTSKPEGVKRLGTAELGPYAHEKRMPSWLYNMLEQGAKVTVTKQIARDGSLIKVESIENETPDLIPILARLSSQDVKIARAFYCSPDVRHITKMAKEGGFCGYRNIQMLISWIRTTQSEGFQNFRGKIPSILRLQDMIENAWDRGYNSVARIETGGIRRTRKYIGTPEAQALFQSLDIPCKAQAFSSTESEHAYSALMQAVFDYFDDSHDQDFKTVITTKPPIYFQHQGHSMTIVGVEVSALGTANLVVFDPMFNVSQSIKKLLNRSKFVCTEPEVFMKAHRRSERYLTKYKDFEILTLQVNSL